jgi:hypothetical protein
MLTFFLSSKVNFEDISLCHPDVSAQHSQHVANIATFDGFFSRHMSCCVIDCQHIGHATTSQQERHNKRGSSAMREVSPAAMQQRTMKKRH